MALYICHVLSTWGLIWNNVVTYLSKCGTLILLITIQKEQRLKFFSNGQQVPFFEYSMYLRHDLKTIAHSISHHLILRQSEGQELPSILQKGNKHLYLNLTKQVTKKMSLPSPKKKKRSNPILKFHYRPKEKL